jgi:uncharacterized protein
MFNQIFKTTKPIIGMIHLPPLLGYPEFTAMEPIIERALADLRTLEQNGIDGVAVDNEYDHPHQLVVGPEIIASFTCVVNEIVKQATVPVGLEVLLNDWRGSFAIAKSTNAQFIRLDFFVDKVKIEAGIIDPNPVEITDYRRQIKAENLALFTDIQVKYSELLEEKTLTESAQQAMQHGANAIIISGKMTGDMPVLDDLQEVKQAVGGFPVLVGSGATPQNIRDLLQYADGVIVGTALKSGREVNDRIVADKVRNFMSSVQKFRER